MSDKRLECSHRRGTLYAEFVGRVDAITSSIQRSALNGDTANILVDVDRIKALRVQLDLDLNAVYERVFGGATADAGERAHE